VVRGKEVTDYPACAPEVIQAGGCWVDVPLDQAIADGSLVTGPAWPAHPAWLAKFLEVLGTRVEHGVAAVVRVATAALGGLRRAGVRSRDAERRGGPAPLAWVIIGGLVSSTLLARIVTPVLYKLLPPTLA
jgi:hypothetical protein